MLTFILWLGAITFGLLAAGVAFGCLCLIGHGIAVLCGYRGK